MKPLKHYQQKLKNSCSQFQFDTDRLLLIKILQDYLYISLSRTKNDQIRNIIKQIILGLQIRKQLIEGVKVYQRSFTSINNHMCQLTQQQKKLHDRCIFLLDKHFYQLNNLV